MRIKTFLTIVIGGVLIASLLNLGVYAYHNIIISGDVSAQGDAGGISGAINAFTVADPHFVVAASDLSAVEIWAIPAGSEVAEEEYQLLGAAALRSPEDLPAQIWTLAIPSSPVLATEIFARGFDRDGGIADQVSLPHLGATAVYEGVWNVPPLGALASVPASSTAIQRKFFMTLGVGEKGSAGALGVKLLKITNDSRCPQNAVCVSAGEVVMQVEFSVGTKTQKAILRSSGQPYVFGDYRIDVAGVGPARRGSAAPAQNSYQIEFAVEKAD